MNRSVSFFQSRFGRRILTLFLVCAFLPTALLVGFAYHRVKAQLYEDSWLRMDKECKTYAMGLIDRLIHMDFMVRLSIPALIKDTPLTQLPTFQYKQLTELFYAIGVYTPEQGLRTRHGNLDLIKDTLKQLEAITPKSDKSFIHMEPSESPMKTLYLLIPFEDNGHKGLIVARPTKSILWGIGAYSVLPAQTELAIYDHHNTLLAATRVSPGPNLPSHVNNTESSYIQFEYTQGNQTYMASGWSLFLTSHFNAPTWTIILSTASDDILSTISQFRHSFPLAVLLMLWIILFLSLYFIRRTITPLTLMQESTQKVGAGDFSHEVTIASGDEFEQLADSFNTMTKQIQQQMQTLTLIDNIDRAILSSLDPSIIIPRSLRLISDFFHTPMILLAQCAASDRKYLQLTQLQQSEIGKAHAVLADNEWPRLFKGKASVMLHRQSFLPAFLAEQSSGDSFLFLPLRADRTIQGALILESAEGFFDHHPEAVAQARQIADQLAIALNNARLVSNLEKLSIGAVEALARTVDAKSKWTSGHSERVAELAVKIGKALRCDDRLLEQLFRGGLLHDIGKIGIPVAILDKPSRLNDEEYATIQTHPQIGGQILEPIEVYQDVIPMIVQHHERFDGKGYPEGISGESICLGARILSVADVYDALISQRPYRDGWVKEKVHDFLRENSGFIFDPKVVNAFLLINT